MILKDQKHVTAQLKTTPRLCYNEELRPENSTELITPPNFTLLIHSLWVEIHGNKK